METHLIQRNFKGVIIFTWLLCVVVGCTSTQKTNSAGLDNLVVTAEDENIEDAVSALGSVAGAMSNQVLDEQQLEKVAKQLRDDKEAQEAVKAIAESMDTKRVRIKYSPATGKRYSAELDVDPETGVKLLPLE